MSDASRFVAPARSIALLTLVSRLLGLGREMLYAGLLGTGPALSAFRVAWQIPNLSRRLFGEGALSAAFIPVLTDCLHREGPPQARRLAGTVLSLLAVVLGAAVIAAEIGVLAAYAVCPSDTLRLTALLLPYTPLICVTALTGGVLNVLNRFAAPALAPVLLNVFIIAAAAAGGWILRLDTQPLLYLICGAILVGGAAQLALVTASVRRAGFRPVLSLRVNHPGVRKVLSAMAPMALGMSVVQVNTLADSLIALWCVADGRGPAVLGYAHFFYQLPLGVLGVALGTAIFPLLAARASAGDRSGVTRACEQGIRMSLFVGVPSAVGLCLVAEPLMAAFFERGRFLPTDSVRAGRCLLFYGSGVWAYFLQQILVRAFYAVKDHGTPVRVAVTVMVLNVALNLTLVYRLGEAGVALATALCAVLQVLWLGALLRRRLPGMRIRWLASGITRIAAAALVLAAAVTLPLGALDRAITGAIHPGLRVALSVGLGAVSYALASGVLRLEELREILHRRSQ